LARDAGPGLGPGATPPPRPFWRPPPVRPDAEETPERAGGRGGKARDAIVPVGGAVAMAAAMAAMTRNPVFALLPLLGVFGYLSPRLARLRPMRSVIDVDAAAIAAAPPAPPAAAGHTGAAEPAGPPAGSARRLPDAARDPAGGLRLIPWDRVIAPGETVWVTGEPRAAAALARTWLLAEAAGRPPGFIEIHAAGPRPAWAWSRWFTPAAPALSVSVGQGAPNRRPRGSSSPAVDVVIAPSAPRGAADVVEVRATGLGLVAARLAGGPAALFLPPGAKLAEALARQAAGAALPPGGASDLTGVLPPEQTAARWAAGGLAVPIGVDRSGSPLALDLPRDGPHLLVAGATGSGKSEFLRSLILGCALSAGPDQLTIVGIDHKGGATFSGLDTLPHLAGLVTDLDAEGSRRAIVSLAAELTRRERLLERAGAQDFAALPPAERPPRILVVIDEFRALVESLPDAESRLERLAAQGRSLGMHLVLATQRPAGAVSAHLRANLALRICFRVAGDTDSMDVIDSSMAAHIDPRLPGTACLASAGRPTRSFRALLACGPAPAPPTARAWPDQWEAPPAGPVPAPDAIVRQIVQAAASLGLAPAQPPWRPPLPHAIALGELAGAHGGQAEGAPPAGEAARAAPLTIGLADSPETLNQFPLRVHPDHGNLLVIGAPRTGRTTAARTVAAAALARGWEVHAVTATPGAFADLTAHPCFGTLVGRDEPRRLARLLRVLRDNPASTGAAGPSGPPHPSVLIADDAEALASLPLAGFDDHPLEALGAARAERWPGLVATGLARHAAARWTGHFPARLVLPTIDRSEDVAAGVSSALAGGRVAPGRAVYLRPGVELLAHVATAHAAPAGGRRAPCPGPLRLAPVPTAVRVSELPAPRPGWAWAGLGGDTAQPVGVPLEPGRLVAVIGPPGSGKTALADLMAAQAVAAGARPERVDGDSANPWPVIESLLAAGKLVVADNLDRAPGCPPFLPATGTLVATMSTTGAAGFHGPGNLVRARPTAIVLWPETPGSSEAVGVRLAEGLDPRAPRRPGRGIVVNSQAIEPIQCPAPAPARTGPRFALRN
jgi:S-DNA-T family DNA segregation ATPase FtsK/SpoIIIE